jgi:hypothetical protein
MRKFRPSLLVAGGLLVSAALFFGLRGVHADPAEEFFTAGQVSEPLSDITTYEADTVLATAGQIGEPLSDMTTYEADTVLTHDFSHFFSTFEQPDISSRKISRFVPQTVQIVELKDDGWALISTAMGDQWTYLHDVNSDIIDTVIILNNDYISLTGTGVNVDNNTVNIYAGGIYMISGVLGDGQIRITAPYGAEIQLIMLGAEISNSTGAAIYTANPSNLHITLSVNSLNSLSNRSPNTAVWQAALYSRGDLVLSGEGKLTITSEQNNGIVSHKNLTIISGNYDITTDGGFEGAGPGLSTDRVSLFDSYKGLYAANININGGSITISSSRGDAVYAETDVNIYDGIITIQTNGFGINAWHTANIHGGYIFIKHCYEGIEADFINISGGFIDIHSADDGINNRYSRGIITISGGEIHVTALGDAIDSNNALVISGGSIFLSAEGRCPMSQAIDVEGHNNFRLYGGTAVGASTLISNMPREHSEQPSLYVSFVNRLAAYVEIVLYTTSHEKIVEFRPPRSFYDLLITDPQLVIGETYLLYLDGERALSVRLNQAITRFTH